MKKSICSLFLFIILVFSVTGFNAAAAATEIIDGAEITVDINTDGTASVSEVWTVSYLGSSDVFYRNFDVYSASGSMSLLENYEEIKDISVKIDGASVIEAEKGVNTYSVSEKAETLEIAVNCPSSQTTREYTIEYTLTGSLKKVGKQACFSSMLLGDSFVYTSNNVSVNVIFPEGTKGVRVPDGAEAAVNGNTASFISKRVFDVFSVEVYADDSVFEEGALVRYSQAKDGLHKAGNLLVSVIPWILAVIGAFLVVILVLLPERLMRIPCERRAGKMMKADGANTQLPAIITPCTAYKMLCPASRIRPKSSAKKVPVLFGMAILECIENGYIIPDGNDLIVGTPTEKIPEYISSVLNFLKTFSDKKGNKFVIDKSFAEKVSNECTTRYDVITNYLATFYSLIPSAGAKFFRDENNKELYENEFIAKETATHEKHKTDFARALGMVLSGTGVRENSVFSLLFASVSEKTFASGGRTGEQALCEALQSMYKVYTKSK